MDIIINPEYERIVPKLSDQEFQSLKESIKNSGLHVPLTINQNGILLDGHHRYKACQELGLTPDVQEKCFNDPLQEKLFVIDVNLERRQLNDYQRSKLFFSKKSILDQIAERNQKAKLPQTGQKGFQPVSSNQLEVIGTDRGIIDILAEDAGVSHETMRRVQIIEERGTEEQKQRGNAGEAIKTIFDEIRNKEKLEETQEKIASGTPLTDEEIMVSLNVFPRPYDVWNFSSLDKRFGQTYPGQIPAGIVFNTLFFFTKQGDLVVDFMAGAGVVGDVCKSFKRQCLMYDVNPVRDDIKKHDITKGIPTGEKEEVRNAELFFWDSPYYKKKIEEYGPNSISALTRDEYLNTFKTVTDKLYNQTNIQKIALLVSDYDDEYNGHPEENIFVWDYVNTITKSGYWRVHRHIHCPLSTQQIQPYQMTNYIKERKLHRISRSLVIFYRNK